MRCPDCNKFVSLDLSEEPEETGLAIDEDGRVTAEVRIVRTCTECSQELKEANLYLDVDLSEMIAQHKADVKDGMKDGTHELEVELENLEAFEQRQTHDRRGKKITNPRYQRNYFGARAVVKVTCACGEEFTDEWEDRVAASGMEELV